MKIFYRAIKKIEYGLPLFLLLGVKLPFEQWKTAGMSFLFLCAAVAVLMAYVIRRTGEGGKPFVFILMALLLSGDMTKSLFMPSFSFSYAPSLSAGAVLKTVSFLIFLLAAFLIRKPCGVFDKPAFKFTLPFICGAGVLFSPSFLLFFVPVLLLFSSYEHLKKDTGKIDKTGLIILIFCLVVSAFFIAKSLSGNYKILGVSDIGFVFTKLAWNGFGKALLTILPLFLIFAVIWSFAYKTTSDKRMRRFVLFCALEPLLVVLLNVFFYYAASDGWKYCILTAYFTQFCLVFYLWDSGEKPVSDAVKKLGGFFRKNLFVLLAAIVYLVKSADILYN